MIIFYIILGLLVVVGLSELSSLIVCGGLIQEENLDVYFTKYIEDYRKGTKTGTLLHGNFSKPFCSRSISSPLSKWRISNYGRIARWSKWNKELDECVEILPD